jgi:hypothetical protein
MAILIVIANSLTSWEDLTRKAVREVLKIVKNISSDYTQE